MIGKNYLQWYGTVAQLVVTESELIKEILSNKDGAFPKFETQPLVKKLLGDGLVNNEGEMWAKLRRLANHAFHGESLKGMTPAMVTAVEIMLESWKSYEGQEMEVYEEFRLLTSDVISRTAFGNNYQNGKNIFEMLMSKFFKISDEIESDKPEMEIRNNIMKIIKEREEKVISGKENSFGNDFLGILVKAHHDVNDNQRISKDNLVD
ncbi:hypothetical protein FEM48_Zijuj10G0064700 [Ziziphus jujuba var. spinosa]|uniref:Cytochrome P450 CYP749A22-like n=1 Tax=Ziziphus jujuba var. spinosa TaxID=714518 RepID=A0A978ULU7_ZIZJJ|nr:hypothetical protein FEM48_Zijuj10G0064700 [Ziziphus jujuba var. spinosa]